MGISYCLPVRLSVIVSVSAMQSFLLVLRPGGRRWRSPFLRHAIILRQPAAEIGELAALAAEGPPAGRHGLPLAVHTTRLGVCQTLLFNREGTEVVNSARSLTGSRRPGAWRRECEAR